MKSLGQACGVASRKYVTPLSMLRNFVSVVLEHNMVISADEIISLPTSLTNRRREGYAMQSGVNSSNAAIRLLLTM